MDKQDQIHIIGAGCFGLSAAYHLSKYGYKNLIVYDRDRPPAQDAASTDINKIVRSEYADDTLYQFLALESMKIWNEWNQEAQMYHDVGVFLVSSEQASAYESKSFHHLKKVNEPVLLNQEIPLDRFQALKDLRTRMTHGHFNSNGGYVESSKAIDYMYHKLVEMGVSFMVGVEGSVEKLIKNEMGHIAGLQTKNGQKHFGKVILASGAWSPTLVPELKDLFEAHGQPVVHLKVDKAAEEMFLPKNCPVWSADLATKGFYGFPSIERGIIKIGHHGAGYTYQDPSKPLLVPSPKTIVTHPESGAGIPKAHIEKVEGFFKKAFPNVKFDICYTRMCWYTDTFDGDFFITKVPSLGPDFLLATGGSGHGFKFFPVLGSIVVDVLEGKESEMTKRFKYRTRPEHNVEMKKEASRAQENLILNLDEVELFQCPSLK